MDSFVHKIAVVVPVFQGERTLERLIDQLTGLTNRRPFSHGRLLQVVEVVLVYDNGPDSSDEVIRRLARARSFVRPVWLSRNYGQHAATLAGMASTSADWIVTLDEDGQHNPADIPRLLDVALDEQVPLVYGDATNAAPHGFARNAASSFARWLATSVMTSHELGRYTSYRLIVGELGRAVAAYGGQDIYLDVALSWVVPSSTQLCQSSFGTTPNGRRATASEAWLRTSCASWSARERGRYERSRSPVWRRRSRGSCCRSCSSTSAS